MDGGASDTTERLHFPWLHEENKWEIVSFPFYEQYSHTTSIRWCYDPEEGLRWIVGAAWKCETDLSARNPLQQIVSDNYLSNPQMAGKPKHGVSMDRESPVTGNPEARSSYIREDCSVQFSSVHFSRSVVSDSLWMAARQASLSITNSRSSLRLTSIESVMPSSHLILGRPLLLLPRIPPSIRVFSNESTLHMRWPKYWSFSFSIIPSKEIPGLISFRMDWLDLLAVQETLKSLLQHSSQVFLVVRG